MHGSLLNRLQSLWCVPNSVWRTLGGLLRCIHSGVWVYLNPHDLKSHGNSINPLMGYLVKHCRVKVFILSLCALSSALITLDRGALFAAPPEADSLVLGSVIGEAQVAGVWTRNLETGDADDISTHNLSAILGIRLGADYVLSHVISVGGDLGISMIKSAPLVIERLNIPQSYDAGTRLALNPALKLRLDFPLNCRWVVESELALGVAYWGATRNADAEAYDESRWGVTTRVHLGVRYLINTQVHLLVGGGYHEYNMALDQGSITLSAFPILVGLRGGF